MRLFYAQSGNNKITVTAPYKTFASKSTFDNLYGVKPYAYLDSTGVRKNFKASDFKEVNYYPLNSGHYHIEVIFSNSFNPVGGAVIYCRAMFNSLSKITFSLPYVKSSNVGVGDGSTAVRTLSITRDKSLPNPTTIFKAYKDSQLVNTESYASKAFSGDINKFDSPQSSVLEYVGVTTTEDPNLTYQFFTNNSGKFLTTSDFTEGIVDDASYFYVYAENISTVDIGTNTGDGCLDTTASNAGSYGFNDSSCVYVAREPRNIKISTTVSDLNDIYNKVVYTESNLGIKYDVIGDITPTLTINGGTIGSYVETINVENDFSTYQVVWERSAVGSSALDTSIKDNTPFARIVVVDTEDSETRTFYFPTLVAETAGCNDASALNYDADATPCAECCLKCEDLQLLFNTISYNPLTALAGVNDTTDDDNTTVYGATNINFAGGGTLANQFNYYLATLPASYWTINYYNTSQVELPPTVAGEQAIITGSPLLSDTNDGGDASVILVYTPPTTNSGLYPGSQYVAEFVFNNGSGCTFYAYNKFIVPYDGCLDPSATNYLPIIGNTGNGNCTYNTDRICEQSIITYASNPTLVDNDQAVFTLTIEGQSDDGVTVTDFGQYAVSYTLVDYTTDPASFLGAVNVTQAATAGPDNTITFTILIPQNSTANIVVTELVSGCAETIQVEHPGIVLYPGCTDPLAINYDPEANDDNGGCIYCSDLSIEVASTTDATGTCSSSSANGSVTFTVNGAPGNFFIGVVGLFTEDVVLDSNVLTTSNLSAGVYTAYVVATVGPLLTCTAYSVSFAIGVSTSGCGCTDPGALNYDATATEDDGSCIIPGCTNTLAVNYNPNATNDDGSCIYSATPNTPLCIPKSVDNQNAYEVTLDNIKKCISQEGKTLLFKIKGGIKCDTVDQVKLTLVSYLINRIGLECLYNCNYTYQSNGEAYSCQTAWEAGGPSGEELVWSNSTAYVIGDIVKYTIAGTDYYYTALQSHTATTTPPQYNYGVWQKCNDVVLPSGTETYLNTFINFARKFCLVCFSDTSSQANPQETQKSNILGDITLESGDNIEL